MTNLDHLNLLGYHKCHELRNSELFAMEWHAQIDTLIQYIYFWIL